jgi:hypothetical protein
MEADDDDFTRWEDAFDRRDLAARTAEPTETDEEGRLASPILEQALTPLFVRAYLDQFGS